MVPKKVRTKREIRKIINDYLRKYGARGDVKKYWENIEIQRGTSALYNQLRIVDIKDFKKYVPHGGYTFSWHMSPQGHEYWERILSPSQNVFVEAE